MTTTNHAALDAAEKYAYGRCLRNNLGTNKQSSFFKGTVATFLVGYERGQADMLVALRSEEARTETWVISGNAWADWLEARMKGKD